MLGFALCQRMRRVLAEETPYAYLDDASAAELRDRREEMGPVLRRPGLAFQTDDDAVRLWTFAGGRINHTLKYALEATSGWKVVSDNVRFGSRATA